MNPGRRRKGKKPTARVPRLGPDPHDEHEVKFYRTASGAHPAREYLATCPEGIRDRFRAVVAEVAKAPPHRFSGGGYWEAMHGSMAGWFEVRIDGPGRTHYRLYCLVDANCGDEKPYLVPVTGRTKRFQTTIKDSEYANIRELGSDYLASRPRRVD